MGFRFSTRIGKLPGLKLNLSGSGVSLSAGFRGAHLNFGYRGTYASVGLPGTGLGYRQRIGGGVNRSAPSQLTPEQIQSVGKPSGMRKSLLVVAIGLLFANGNICFGSFGDWFTPQPHFVAQAEFSVNWNQMPAKDQEFNPQKARKEFKNHLANFKVSKQFVSILCDNCKISSDQSASITANLGRYLKITPAGTSNHVYLYRIQYKDANSDVALNAVKLLCNRLVTGINRKAKSANLDKAVHSFQDNAKSQEKEEKLRTELASLTQAQGQEYSADRQARIQDIQDELNQNDLDKMMSGFGMLAYGFGSFTNPAKVEQDGVVHKQ